MALRNRTTCRAFLQQKLTRGVFAQFIEATISECQQLLDGVFMLCYAQADKFEGIQEELVASFFNIPSSDLPAGAYLINSKSLQLEDAKLDMIITPEDHAPHNARVCKDAHFSIFFFVPVKSTVQDVGPLYIHFCLISSFYFYLYIYDLYLIDLF